MAVTVPMLREQQDKLGKVSNAGAKFFATAGAVVNTDDFVISKHRKQFRVAYWY